jgi:hypothetical protein
LGTYCEECGGNTLGTWWECIVNSMWTHKNLDLGTCGEHQYLEIQAFPTFKGKIGPFGCLLSHLITCQECMFLTTFVTFFAYTNIHFHDHGYLLKYVFVALGEIICKFKYHEFRSPIFSLLDMINITQHEFVIFF